MKLTSLTVLSLIIAFSLPARAQDGKSGLTPPVNPDRGKGAASETPVDAPVLPSTDFSASVEQWRATAVAVSKFCAEETKARADAEDALRAYFAREEDALRATEQAGKPANKAKVVPTDPMKLSSKNSELVARALKPLERICKTYGPEGQLPVTVFADKGKAAAAVALDADAIDNIAYDLKNALLPIDKAFDAILNTKATPLGTLYKAVQSQTASGLLSGDVGAAALDFLGLGLAGLANLIADRARYEAVGWFLEELGENLCVTEGATDEKHRLGREMQRHVMPAMCQLASAKQLWEYGAGAALWQSLQAAAASDLKGLPGAAIGFASLGLLKNPGLAIGCAETDTDGACALANSLRRKTAARTSELLQGDRPTVVLDAWAADLVLLRRTSSDDKIVKPMLFDGVTCAAAVPRFVETWSVQLKEIGLTRKAAPLFSAALISLATGSCEKALVGAKLDLTGFERAKLRLALATDDGLGVKAAADVTTERLSAFIALTKTTTYAEAGKLEAAVQRLDDALARVEALRNPKSTTPATSAFLPQVQITGDADPESVTAAVSALTAGTQSKGAAERVDAVLAVADASLDVAIQLVGLIATLDPKVPANEITKVLGQLRKGIAIGRAAAKGEWAVVVNGSIVLVNEIAEAHGGSSGSGTGMVAAHLRTHGRDLATVAAIASAKSGDEMAKALDALADPPGGWRSKRVEYQDTVSLTAYAGFYGAAEFRYGTYGAKKERGDVHGQPPTLTLPLGIEYSRGFGCTSINVFLSVIDPAAFLGYDVETGKVTGASLLTVLSPGAMLSLALGTHPSMRVDS